MNDADILQAFEYFKSISDQITLYRKDDRFFFGFVVNQYVSFYQKGDSCFTGFVVGENSELSFELSKGPIESNFEFAYGLNSENNLSKKGHEASIETFVTCWNGIPEERIHEVLEILPPQKREDKTM